MNAGGWPLAWPLKSWPDDGELDNSTYAIVSGLKAGDQVIVSQIQKLRDGAPVETSPAKPAGAGSASVAAEH